jgi:hypothetical protein
MEKEKVRKMEKEKEVTNLIKDMLDAQRKIITEINKEHEKALKEASEQPFRIALGDMDNEDFMYSLVKQAQEYLEKEIREMHIEYENVVGEMSDGWYDYWGMLADALSYTNAYIEKVNRVNATI